MSKAANKAKTKWNSENYTQVKAYVNPRVASAFKTACAVADVSVNSVLSQFMADYCSVQTEIKPEKAADFISTNRKRRKKHEELIQQLIQLRDAQEYANCSVHENLRNTENFEAATERVSKMDEAIGILEDVY